MFKNIGWTLGNDCPCNYNHCYSKNVREKGMSLNKDIVNRVIGQVKAIGAETINLGGNEPLFTNGLDPSKSLLPYIIDLSIESGLTIGITSAGPTIIGLEELYNEQFKKINDIDISIDSPYEHEHNANRGANIFNMAIKSLEICNKYNIPHTIVMCAMKWNFTIDRIQKLTLLAKKYNANIRINMLKPTEKKHLELMPSKDQIKEGYNWLINNCYTINISDPILSASYSNNNTDGCYCGINSLRINSITPDGKISISPCVYMHHHKVGNLLEDDLIDIVKSKQFHDFIYRKEHYKEIDGCQNCDKLMYCKGGCAASAYWYNFYKNDKDTMLGKDPYCIYGENEEKSKIKVKSIHECNLVHENYLCTWIGKTK